MAKLSYWPRFLLIATVLLVLAAAGIPPTFEQAQPRFSYIVQARSSEAAAAAVSSVGGTVTQTLRIVNGVAASLDQAAAARLRANPEMALHADGPVQASGVESSPKQAAPRRGTVAMPEQADEAATEGASAETYTRDYLLYPAAATGANTLHNQMVPTSKTECKDRRVTTATNRENRPLRGWGVTVAVVDSGLMQMEGAAVWTHKDAATGTLVAEAAGRCIVYRDFLERSVENGNKFKDIKSYNSTDQHGHGTHVISTIVDNRQTQLSSSTQATPVGVAPQVNLLVARALDKDGAGTYSTVISAIEWVVANKQTYNVRVLNLSLYAPVQGPYWADPINQAVMRAWQAGIVVVVAAGNQGPDAGTITAPGNVPYVITVGAIKSGRYTESGYDELATYSSRGPTESAFVKPDLVVPASRTIAPIPDDSTLARLIPEASIQETARVNYGIGAPAKEHTYFRLSGTSMAAPQISGVVALMLQVNPNLTNDQVKYRIMDTARAAIDATTGEPIYSIWEQGAGLVSTSDAVFATSTESANANMDVSLDLSSTTHYWGNTTWDEASGDFLLFDPVTGQTHVWDGGLRTWAGGLRTWAGGLRTWAGGLRTWAGGLRTWAGSTDTWSASDSMWAGGLRTWAGSTTVPSTSAASRGELLISE
ncbi:MAG TPA: S8 family peptidase [Herpetosiphonaceae bacterium]